jgi:hypothetical protein
VRHNIEERWWEHQLEADKTLGHIIL